MKEGARPQSQENGISTPPLPTKGAGMNERNIDLLEATRGLRKAQADTSFSLDVFGDHIAEKEGYKGISGQEALHLYLIRRYGWLPRDVRSMSVDDLSLALHVEQQDWTWPAEVVAALEGRPASRR